MSQVLFRDIETPADFSWSSVSCENNEKLMNYLKQDSIIIVSSNFYQQNKILLCTVKLTFPDTRIGVINLKKDSDFVKSVPEEDLEKFVQSSIRRKYEITDRLNLLNSYLEIINKNIIT